MATITRSNIGNLHDKLTVKISKEDYAPAFEKALKNYSKNVNIPGFRKGMVPTGMVKKMYGNSIMIDEILRTANNEVEKYLQEEKPQIFAQPLAMPLESLNVDVNNMGDYEFDFEIGLKPNFEISKINEKGAVTRYDIAIDEKLVDLEIDNIQKRAGTVENPETIENDTDIVYASYEIDGNKFEDVISLDKTPGNLKTELKGQKVGFSKEINLGELSEDELRDLATTVFKKDQTELKDKTALFTLTKVGRIIPKELGTELYNDVFQGKDVKDEAEFRALLKEEIGKEGTRLTNDKLQNDIFEMLIHETNIELPTEFLKNWIKRGGEKIKTDEEVATEYPSFEHQLRWTLISDKLITEYGINVTLDEVLADLKSKVLTYFGADTDGEEPEWLAEYMDKMSKDSKTIDENYRRLLFDKLFNKIAEVIEPKVETVSGEEFGKIGNKYHQH
jgi:trigger factor